MATTWDWGPVAQGLGGLMQHFAQKRQYENLLKTLGTGMQSPGQFGPFGQQTAPQPQQRTEDDSGMPIPGRAPQPPTGQANDFRLRPLNPQELAQYGFPAGSHVQVRDRSPAPIQQAQGGGMTTGFMPGEWDWMSPRPRGILESIFGAPPKMSELPPSQRGPSIGLPGPGGEFGPNASQQRSMIDPRMMEMFRKLPPQIGMPLLMQTMQQQMGGGRPTKLEQFDPEKDVVDPYTGQIVRKGAPKQTAESAKALDLTPDEIAAIGLPKGTVAQRKADGTINVVSTPKDTAGRKYDVVNGVAGWIDPESGFTPDPNAPKQAQGGEGAETWANPVTEAGPDGKPIQVRYGNRGGRRVVEGASPAQSASGQPTVDQARANQLYTRAKEQLPIVMENFDALGTTRSALAENLPGGSMIASPAFQRADGALKDIAASYLYSVSGATATPSEIEGTVDRVRPKVTDSAATKADKKKRIRDMVESIKLRSSNPAQPSAPAPSSDGWTTLPNGIRIREKK